MKIKKLLKIIKNKWHLDYWMIFLLPLSVVFGVLIQLGILSKYNSVLLFSWSQIFIDTAIIFPLFFSLALGYFSYYYFRKLKTGIICIILSIIYLCFFVVVSFFGVYFIFGGINNYFTGIIIYFALGYLVAIIPSFSPEKNIKKKSNSWLYLFPGCIFILFILLIFLIFYTSSMFISYVNKDLSIVVEDKKYDILYMNDKYILYGTGNILRITDDTSFDFARK